MKIQCPECKTVHSIEESKIPDKGVYARCRKCKSRFFVKNKKELTGSSKKVNSLKNAEEGKKCPKCGYIAKKPEDSCPMCGLIYRKYEEKNKCPNPKCKAERNPKDKRCPKCGLYYDAYDESQKQKKKVTNNNKEYIETAPKNNMIKFILVAIVIIGISGYWIYSKKENEYISNLKTCHSEIITTAVKCIDMCNEYSAVWKSAINNRKDFNESIMLQRNIYDLEGSINEISESKKQIENLLRKISDPSKKYSEAHKKIIELYGIFSQLYSLANMPSGSLINFNAQSNRLESEFTKLSNELKILTPVAE